VLTKTAVSKEDKQFGWEISWWSGQPLSNNRGVLNLLAMLLDSRSNGASESGRGLNFASMGTDRPEYAASNALKGLPQRRTIKILEDLNGKSDQYQ